ncbi:MAG: CoA transferase [Gordonia amarae]
MTNIPEHDWARSGAVSLTGHAERPIVPPGTAAPWARRCAEILRAASQGTIDVDGPALLGERAAFTGMTRSGRLAPGGHTRLLPTSDGWAALSCSRPDDPVLYGALISDDITGADPWPPLEDWLATHTGAELDERAELLGLAAHSVSSSPRTPLPLHADRSPTGLRVVDFSALWAGPLCARLLGLGGADIIKVETTFRPDGARRGNRDFYNLLHAGHRSVVFDPTDPNDRRRLAELVASADIVIEASRPRALRGFGIDADEVTASGTTWISITAFGRDSHRIGFGDDVAAAAGLVAFDDAGDPVFCGDAIADPLTGLTAAVLALGEPGVVHDLSMARVVASTLTGERSVACVRSGDEWVTPTGYAVAAPRSRPPGGIAPASGADTDTVFGEL